MDDDSTSDRTGRVRLRSRVRGRALRYAIQRLSRTAERVGFWLAVVLPLAYVPLLIDGFGAGDRYVFLGVVAVHALALVLGREHAHDRS